MDMSPKQYKKMMATIDSGVPNRQKHTSLATSMGHAAKTKALEKAKKMSLEDRDKMYRARSNRSSGQVPSAYKSK